MSSCESVYATSEKGYELTEKSSEDPSIIRAKERNILLKFVRTNEIYRGQSYFKNPKEQQYYQAHCRSAPSKKTTKSLMFKSEITNNSSVLEDKPLTKLNEFSAQINRKRNRAQVFESADDIHEKLEKERNCLSARKQYKIEVEEEEDRKGMEIVKKESQNTPKFHSKKLELKEQEEDKLKEKKYISDYNIMKKQEQNKKIIHQETENSPHQLKIHLPYRLHSHKKSGQGYQVEKLKRDLEEKKKEVERYKGYLEQSREKENNLLSQLNQLKHQQIVLKTSERKEKQRCMGMGRDIGLVEMTFLLILLVKMQFQN